MQKIYGLISIVSLLSILSCKKESLKIDDGLYINFTVDGDENNFTKNVEGLISPGYNNAEFFSGAANETSNVASQNIITIGVNSMEEIKTNKEYLKKDMGRNNIAILYIDDMGNRYDLSSLEGDDVLTSDAKIMIVSRTEHSLKGTFSGTLYNTLNINDHHFVSGTFSLKQ